MALTFLPASRRMRISWDLLDQAAFTGWVATTYVQFQRDELLLYPLVLYFLVGLWRSQRRILALLQYAWPFLLFPIWVALSMLWALDGDRAMTTATYTIITAFICLHVAANLTPRQIMHAAMLGASLIGVLNLLEILRGTPVGIFAQKNNMGIGMVLLWTVSAATFLDKQSPRAIRAVAGTSAGIAAFAALGSGSATAVMLVLASGTLLTVGAVFLRGGFFRPTRLGAASLGLGMVLSAAAALLPSLQEDPVEMVLDHFGKDATLTGRTVLWTYATQEIEDRPYLGVGPGGFWNYYQSPLVRRIFEEFHKGANDHFNFHSSYYEIAVHLGLVGLGLAIASALWALWWVVRGALVVGDMPQIYFFAHSLTVLVRTFTESDFLRPFVLYHMLFWIGALLVIRAVQTGEAQRVIPGLAWRSGPARRRPIAVVLGHSGLETAKTVKG